jgi:hypothetical protein
MVIDVYPVGEWNAPCDFTLTGFGYTNRTFVSYIREVTMSKPPDTPLWIVLQTHGAPQFDLRTPIPAEVRLQYWLAVGEGAQAVYWFIYSTQQGWIGLEDNPTLYAEVTSLAQRTGVLRPHLSGAHKVADRFGATGGAYTATLIGQDERVYAVVANQSCDSRTVSVSSSEQGALRDLESGQVYSFGQGFTLSGGDGRMFELIGPQPAPTHTPTRTSIPTATSTSTVCSPRPNVDVAVQPAGAGRLQVTVRANAAAAVPNNRLRQLRFREGRNTYLDIGNRMDVVGELNLPLSPPTTLATFIVRPRNPDLATFLEFIVEDDCGPWPSFVGGGPRSF